MEIRPIDANVLKREILNQLNRFDTSENEFNNCYPYWIFSKTLKEAPTLDYEPVRHGEWVTKPDGYIPADIHCSECGKKYNFFYNPNYCPNCGALMDAKEE